MDIPKLSRKERARVVLREIVSPAMIACFVVVMTLPLWIGPLVYLYLRSLLLAPSGVFMWLAMALVAAGVIWAYISWFRLLARFSKERKTLKERALAGDEASVQAYLDHQRRAMPLWQHATAWIGLQLIIPPAVALFMWYDMSASPDMVRIDGHLRQATPREALEIRLDHLERRGIFKPLGTDD